MPLSASASHMASTSARVFTDSETGLAIGWPYSPCSALNASACSSCNRASQSSAPAPFSPTAADSSGTRWKAPASITQPVRAPDGKRTSMVGTLRLQRGHRRRGLRGELLRSKARNHLERRVGQARIEGLARGRELREAGCRVSGEQRAAGRRALRAERDWRPEPEQV